MKSSLRGGHHLRLLEGGGELFPAMVQAMESARELVHVETYIFEFAGSALLVAEAMERAALRGVTVRLVVDGAGTRSMPAVWRERLERAGVQCRIYLPLGRAGLLIPSRWRRLHRKLCVVDGELGFCGGVNLIDDHDDVALGRLQRPRLDYALQVSGPLVHDMLESMEQLWWRMQAVSRARQHEFRAAWQALRAGRPVLQADRSGSGGGKAQQAALLLRDNVHHRHDIERAYLKAIAQARREIVIANAYFIPGRRLRRALMLAAARGVRVRLLLHGRYEHFLQYHAARTVYQWLLQAGIEIHEYAPSALHAKVAVVDGRWATVGSTNLDPLSLLLAREANIVAQAPTVAAHLRQALLQAMDHGGRVVDAGDYQRRSWPQRWLDWTAYSLMRMAIFLTSRRY